MQKNDLLSHIASAGYNVGFGAKKNFATFDIVSKIPGWIGIISLAVSILGLYMDEMSSKHIAAIFVLAVCTSTSMMVIKINMKKQVRNKQQSSERLKDCITMRNQKTNRILLNILGNLIF